MTDQLAVDYEGSEPFPESDTPPRTFEGAIRVAVTAIIAVPLAGLAAAVGSSGATASASPTCC